MVRFKKEAVMIGLDKIGLNREIRGNNGKASGHGFEKGDAMVFNN